MSFLKATKTRTGSTVREFLLFSSCLFDCVDSRTRGFIKSAVGGLLVQKKR